MAFSRLPISRASSSNPFFINLLHLNHPIPVVHPFAATVPSAPMVAATRSIVARSIYTVDICINLLRVRRSPSVVAPFSASRSFVSGIARSIHTGDKEIVKPFTTVGRYHSSSSSATTNDHTSSQSSKRKALRIALMGRMRHPFLTQGLIAMCNVEEYKGEAIIRVDMPGIGKGGLKLEVKKNSIHMEGKAEKDAEDEEDMVERIYTGVVDIPPGFYNVDEMTASMRSGVLKMVIPKLHSSLIRLPMIEFRGLRIVDSAEVRC